MNIKKFYLTEYPTDELGEELCENANFTGLLNVLNTGKNLYKYIGVADSLVRERLFQKLAELVNEPYDYIYMIWLNND